MTTPSTALPSLATALTLALACAAPESTDDCPAGSADAGLASSVPGLRSAGELEFGPDGVLFVADSYDAQVIAFETGDTTPAKDPSRVVYLERLDVEIATLLGTTPEQVVINDMAVNPQSSNVYFSVHIGRSAAPGVALVWLDVDAETLDLVDTDSMPSSTLSIKGAPDFADELQYGQSLRTLTITDLTYYQGELFIAGVSNEEFSSTLRRAAYPFTDKLSTASVEIFHTSHSRQETRAPIVASLVHEIAGEPHLIAAYTCTPLARFKLSELVDGAHVVGETIAELGFGNAPVDMFEYESSSMFGAGRRVLITNDQRGAVSVGLEAIDAAPPIASGSFQPTGLDQLAHPLTGALHTASFSKGLVLTVRRNVQTGYLSLMSLQTGTFFEVSESTVEFNFPGVKRSPFAQTNPIDYGFVD